MGGVGGGGHLFPSAFMLSIYAAPAVKVHASQVASVKLAEAGVKLDAWKSFSSGRWRNAGRFVM